VTEETLHPTLLCRAHMHHKWVPAQTEDRGQYLRCAHCGKDKTDIDPVDRDTPPWKGFGYPG
jgi:hypothetical protein